MSEGTRHRLAAVISTDMVDRSRLMGADKTGIQAVLCAHRSELIDLKISEHGCRIGKAVGGDRGSGATGARQNET